MADCRDQFREIVSLTARCLEQMNEEGQRDIFCDRSPFAGAGPKKGGTGARGGLAPSVGEKRPGYGPDTAADSPEGKLEKLRREVAGCRKCGLWETRTNPVFGEGSPRARVMFVGEAPGAEEDRTGRPFVGRAGALLTKMLAAIGLRREDVYITNVLKSRPPRNRDPRPEEVDGCEPYLLKQLELIRPLVICALGRHAAQTLLKTTRGIGTLRGRFFDYHGVKIIPTYHPAYLLRSPGEKKKTWEDLKKLRTFLDHNSPPGL